MVSNRDLGQGSLGENILEQGHEHKCVVEDGCLRTQQKEVVWSFL